MRRILAVTAAVLALTAGIGGLASASRPSPEETPTGDGSSESAVQAVLAKSHPQSGDGWEFIGCTAPTGTCSYPQDGTASILMHYPPLPSRVCTGTYPPPTYTCSYWSEAWTLSWYNPEGIRLLPSSCLALYDTGSGLKVAYRCSLPIANRSPGEYRAQLCRTDGWSQTCVEVLLDAYFNVAAPQQEMTFRSIGGNDGWVRERDEDSGKGGILNSGNTTGRVGDDDEDRQYRSILDFDTSGLPDDAVVTAATVRIRRAGVTGTNPFDTHGLLKVDMISGFYHDDPLLERLDFHAVGSRGNVGRFIKTATDRWHRAPLRAQGLPLVNLVGHTQFRLRFDLDDNDDLAADYLSFYTGDAGAADQAQLVVTYYQP